MRERNGAASKADSVAQPPGRICRVDAAGAVGANNANYVVCQRPATGCRRNTFLEFERRIRALVTGRSALDLQRLPRFRNGLGHSCLDAVALPG